MASTSHTGKHLTHIDRAGSYAAREAAVLAVASGARQCRVVVSWAPNNPDPLEVIYEMEGGGFASPTRSSITRRYASGTRVSR